MEAIRVGLSEYAWRGARLDEAVALVQQYACRALPVNYRMTPPTKVNSTGFFRGWMSSPSIERFFLNVGKDLVFVFTEDFVPVARIRSNRPFDLMRFNHRSKILVLRCDDSTAVECDQDGICSAPIARFVHGMTVDEHSGDFYFLLELAWPDKYKFRRTDFAYRTLVEIDIVKCPRRFWSRNRGNGVICTSRSNRVNVYGADLKLVGSFQAEGEPITFDADAQLLFLEPAGPFREVKALDLTGTMRWLYSVPIYRSDAVRVSQRLAFMEVRGWEVSIAEATRRRPTADICVSLEHL